jgi:hypothetical protein
MAELDYEVTQYVSPNKGSGNVGSLDSYESLHPLNLHVLKCNEH